MEEELKEFIGGSFEVMDDEFVFMSNDTEDMPELHEISREIKQLGLILMLIESKGLCEDSFIILDNFDKDMSKKYRLKTAEILVKLTKLLDLTLIINSYSKEFADAIRKNSKDLSVNSYKAKGNEEDKYTF